MNEYENLNERTGLILRTKERLIGRRKMLEVVLFTPQWKHSSTISYSNGSPKVSRFSWQHKTILVAARPETWQFWSRRELHFSLLDERLSILVATCCYEAPQDLLISGRQTRQISSRREMRRGKRAERDMCINLNSRTKPTKLETIICVEIFGK